MTNDRNGDFGPRDDRLPRPLAAARKQKREADRFWRRSAISIVIFSWITVATAFVSVVWDIVNSDICQF